MIAWELVVIRRCDDTMNQRESCKSPSPLVACLPYRLFPNSGLCLLVTSSLAADPPSIL